MMTMKTTSSERAEQFNTQMFPLNVPCCACGDEVQVDERSLSGAEPPDDEGGGGLVIPSSLDRQCGAQPFCRPCARAVRVLASEDINLAVLGRARKAAMLTEQHMIDLYFTALDEEEVSLRADHEALDFESYDYQPFGGEVAYVRPPADLVVTDHAKTIAYHYRVLVARYPRPLAATGLLLN